MLGTWKDEEASAEKAVNRRACLGLEVRRCCSEWETEVREGSGYGRALAWPVPLDLGLRFSAVHGAFGACAGSCLPRND